MFLRQPAEKAQPCAKTSSKRHSNVQPQVEVLEDRTLLSSTPVLLKDINPGAAWSTSFQDPSGFVQVGRTVYFSANDGTSGVELWKTDGTTPGTVRVKDIQAGPEGSFPTRLTNVNGVLYFLADNGLNGRELWKSDGSEAGTVLVKDVNPGEASGFVSELDPYLTAVGSTLYFTANDGTHGRELWKSDGTKDGTVLVRDINAGEAASAPAYLTNVDGTLFFAAEQSDTGVELYKSDGSEAGTVLVFNRIIILPGGTVIDASSSPRFLTNVDGMLFFTAYDDATGVELWKSNGTEAGTILVRDIRPAAESSDPQALVHVNGLLYFTADDGSTGRELWRSDGTIGGTFLVRDINPASGSSSPASLISVFGGVFFRADNGSSGPELWRSDGTFFGTVLVKDINPGSAGSDPIELVAANGIVFFVANDGTHGRELWRSDGTAAGTVLVQDLSPGLSDSTPQFVTIAGGTVYFVAHTNAPGYEPWTVMLPKVIITGPETGGVSLVRVLAPLTGAVLHEFLAFGDFTGGVRVTTGDVNGDGVPDFITAAGPGGLPHIRAFDGNTGRPVAGPLGDFLAFSPEFRGGSFIASGDVNGDGFTDLIVAADGGGGPNVRVFSGSGGAMLLEFFAYAVTFRGGVRVAAGDVDGDGRADIITAAGPSGGPHVKVFRGTDLTLLREFNAYATTFTGGVYVAAGDTDGDGFIDIVTGPGPGGGPNVRIFSSRDLVPLREFSAFDPDHDRGVRIGVLDFNNDGIADILAGTGPGRGNQLRLFQGTDFGVLSEFVAYDPFGFDGLYVAGT